MGYKELWLDKKYSHGNLLALEISRIIIGLLILGFWVNRLFSGTIAILVAVPIIVIVLILFSQKIQKFYQRLEGRFLKNLNAREIAEEENSHAERFISKHFNPESELSPWEAHMVDMEVRQNVDYIGKTLEEIAWREQYRVNIAYIKRGDKLIYAPSRHSRLLPFDRIGIIATDEQLQIFKPIFESTEEIDQAEYNIEDIIVQKFVVDEHNKLKGLTVRDSGIRGAHKWFDHWN